MTWANPDRSVIRGTHQSDRIVLTNASANDAIFGEGGDDEIIGGGGDDKIFGGSGNDTMSGGAGNDTIYGQTGDDVADGGTGIDTFILNSPRSDFLIEVNGGQIFLTRSGVTDILLNIEFVEFSDGTYAVEDLVTPLHAEMVGTRLTLAGEAAFTGAPIRAEVGIGAHGPTLTDGNGQTIPIFGPMGEIRHFDGRGFSGAGIDLTWFYAGNSNIRGTEQDDRITVTYALGNDAIFGHGGDDEIIAGGGDDKIFGGAGDDTMSGGAGNDTIYGQTGADLADGGTGIDTFVINYDRLDCVVVANGGQILVTYNGVTDILLNVEFIEFSDGTFAVEDLVTPLHASLSGTHLDLFGETALPGFQATASVTLASYGLTMMDTNGQSIPIFGPTGTIQHFDGRGFDGAGLTINWFHLERAVIRGSGQDDRITMTSNTGDDAIFGEAGDDEIIASGGDDKIFGGSGNDTMSGGAGNDTIYGQTGNDVADGGLGMDTFVFNRPRSEFSITDLGGLVQVTRGSETDYLLNIEFIEFTDGVFDVGDLLGSVAARAGTAEGAAAKLVGGGALLSDRFVFNEEALAAPEDGPSRPVANPRCLTSETLPQGAEPRCMATESGRPDLEPRCLTVEANRPGSGPRCLSFDPKQSNTGGQDLLAALLVDDLTIL